MSEIFMYNLPPTNRALCFVSLTLYPCANKTNEVVSCVPRSTLPPLLLCRSGVFRPAALGGDDDDGQSCQHDCKECAPGWSICRNPPRMAPVCLAWLTGSYTHIFCGLLATFVWPGKTRSLPFHPPEALAPLSRVPAGTHTVALWWAISHISV